MKKSFQEGQRVRRSSQYPFDLKVASKSPRERLETGRIREKQIAADTLVVNVSGWNEINHRWDGALDGGLRVGGLLASLSWAVSYHPQPGAASCAWTLRLRVVPCN